LNEYKYWLGLSLVPEIGTRRAQTLLQAFGSARAAWAASESDLRGAGLEKTPLANLIHARTRLDLDAEMVRIERAGASLLTLDNDAYPALLKLLPDAPLVLYVRGTFTKSDSRALAIVGTRKATRYGLDAAAKFANQLAQAGVTIISGLAHGIDAAAHQAALQAGGRTLAVLGSGLDEIYPREHRALAESITQHGALISEFPLGAKPEARHFPRRNRVISGLSLGVLVVEAPEKSGALITASAALEHGREVFAVPGSIFSHASTGTNRLIQDGAMLVMDPRDILDALNMAHELVNTRLTTKKITDDLDVTEMEHALLQLLSTEPMHIDDLVRQLQRPVAEISSTLTLLELRGLVNMVGAMQYTLAT